ncbi:MAG TPA: hypothetical protein VK633_11745 [Verrucomicrobiae bacterium]|nr:hypothetical protein [Verrucomicrobiae bacterium]
MRQRECYVVDDAFQERTLQIEIQKVDILTEAFLVYVQRWLQSQAPLWRVAVPTDGTNENLVLVYPTLISVNVAVGESIDAFCERIRPKVHEAKVEGRRKLGLTW